MCARVSMIANVCPLVYARVRGTVRMSDVFTSMYALTKCRVRGLQMSTDELMAMGGDKIARSLAKIRGAR